MKQAKLLVIDNYDSFTHNLVQMFMLYDLDIAVFRADRIGLRQIDRMAPDYLLIGPGPKDPANAGISVPLIREFAGRFPIFGVCLGMQSINEAFGGRTIRAPVPVHGKVSRVHHDNAGLFSGLPNPFTAARYHSLAVDPQPTHLAVTARSDDGVVMGIADAGKNLHGVQFHPESFMTEGGFRMVENFLKLGPLFAALEAGSPLESDLTAFVRYEKARAVCREASKWA